MSRLRHIIQAVYGSPLLMTPEAFRSVHMLIQSKLGETAHMLQLTTRSDDGSETDFFGDPIPQARLEGSVWVVPVHGIIGKRVSGIERSCGVCDVDQIRRDMAAGMESAASDVLMDFSSPGGWDVGLDELTDYIGGLRGQGKGIYAYTDLQMCSAAYNIGVAADNILCSESAELGAVGAYIALLDESIAYALEGLSVDLFKGGRMKAMGLPGTSLTDEMREYLQAAADDSYARFKANVLRYRPDVADESMQGQTFRGIEAVELGMADDASYPTLESVIKALNQRQQ